MEAYFHSDPRIEEWVDQITEKIFTVCLLTGADSEVEFQKGCQIVTKLTRLLLGISIFPAEYLEDGLKQLVEQQLPDARVINNFPTFQEIMNRMLKEGLTKAIDSQGKENFKPLATSTNYNPENSSAEASKETSEGAREEFSEETFEENIIETIEETCEDPSVCISDSNKEAKTPIDVTTGSSVNTSNEEFVTELAIPALVSVNLPSRHISEPATEITSSFVPPLPSKPYGIIRKTQVPEQADRLKQVLSIIFPNVTVTWNLSLMDYKFLAQVEDILICQDDPEQPCPVKILNKEGWKVYVTSDNDLIFPRRLERAIRHLKRSGKKRVN